MSAFLKRTHVDEIPQFWNVCKGDMSLVGPRPYDFEECEKYKDKISGFSSRHSVKPGITGLAQINYDHGNDLTNVERKLCHDLYYVENSDLKLDLLILARTLVQILSR